MATKSNMQLFIDIEYERLVPPLNKQDYERLYNSIKNNGLREPIVINEHGAILDGHNRFKICEELYLPLKTRVETFGNSLLEKKYVIETNLERRHLNDFQKAELGIPLLEIEKELAKLRELNGKTLGPNDHRGKSRDLVSKQIGLSSRTFERAKVILEKAPEELKERVRTGQTSINYAYKSVNRAEKKKNSKPIPITEFNVILADPPWQYDINTRGSPDDHYDVLTLDEICKMKVPSAKDCILFLWATAPKLKEALHVLETWGFDYKTHMIWIKDKIGTGYYFRGQHELLLVGKKGNISIPEEKDRPSSVLYAERTKHSMKPEKIYNIIEKMYPNSKYLELFARNTRQGWHSWGDEV